MRSREEIMSGSSPKGIWGKDTVVNSKLILEVLLDIRELLIR